MAKVGGNAERFKLKSFYRPHKRVFAPIVGASRTKSEFKDECNINSIMKRYAKTGVISHVSQRAPFFVDTTEMPDLMTAMNVMIAARQSFMSLSADVRKQFDNDPVKFVEFAEDPENIDQMREWGLAPPKAVEPGPMRVEVINPPSEAPIEPVTPSEKKGKG